MKLLLLPSIDYLGWGGGGGGASILFPVKIFFSFAFNNLIVKSEEMKTKSELGLEK